MEIQNDHSILAEFLDLDQFGQVQAEYVWIGGSGQDLRSKTRVCENGKRFARKPESEEEK
jgi:hypothetical protein